MLRLPICVCLTAVFVLSVGCMRVAHLGNHTGEAYHAAVTAQARPGGDEEQAPMEAELASRAAASMIAGTSDRPARGSRPQLSLPVVPIGH